MLWTKLTYSSSKFVLMLIFVKQMIDKTEETVQNRTPGFNNLDTPVLTHERINSYLVVIFTNLNKAHINKMPYRDSPQQEINLVMSFIYLNLFNQMNTQKNVTLEKQTIKIFYSNLKKKDLITLEIK